MVRESLPVRRRASVVTTTAAGGLVAGLYLTIFSYRLDYSGHFLAGFGVTLGIVAVTARRLGTRAGVVGAVALTAVIGAVSEGLFFTSFFYDPIDVCNLAVGGVVAGAALLDRDLEGDQAWLAGIGCVAIAVGLALRYLTVGPGPW